MAKAFLLVDGYNIIHDWENLKQYLEISLESARQRLLEILSNYQGTVKSKIIVVFDGYLVKGNVGTVYEYHNVFVVYTKEAETADRYIERAVANLPRHYDVRVATSDALEQIIILGQGATRISARELWIDVQGAEKALRHKYVEMRSPKNNLLSENIDEDALAFIEELRRQK